MKLGTHYTVLKYILKFTLSCSSPSPTKEVLHFTEAPSYPCTKGIKLFLDPGKYRLNLSPFFIAKILHPSLIFLHTNVKPSQCRPAMLLFPSFGLVHSPIDHLCRGYLVVNRTCSCVHNTQVSMERDNKGTRGDIHLDYTICTYTKLWNYSIARLSALILFIDTIDKGPHLQPRSDTCTAK